MTLRPATTIAAIAGTLTMLTVLATPLAAPARAGDNGSLGSDYYAGLSCGQLWYERNAIFARYGYCFKSERGIATFGAGCHPPFGRLPSNLRRVVNHIKRVERWKGC